MARVLIADDQEEDRLLFRSILEAAGHELYFATNGEEALKLYLRHDFEAVVTDIQMPRGDGIELITAIKGLDREASIIAVSGHSRERLDMAQLVGALKVLPKPLDRDGLLEAVEEAANPPDADRTE